MFVVQYRMFYYCILKNCLIFDITQIICNLKYSTENTFKALKIAQISDHQNSVKSRRQK